MLASLPELKKQNTLQTVRSFCGIAKKSALFQKVYLGWKLSQIINKQRGVAGKDLGCGVRNKNVLGGQNRKIN